MGNFLQREMSQTRNTEVSFKGTLAFADTAAAQRLVEVVNSMLERSMEVFWKAKGDADFCPQLVKELQEMDELCWNFVKSAKTQKAQDNQKQHYATMQSAIKSCCDTLNEYKAGQEWTLAQSENLERGFKSLYVSLQNMMNESESEVATSLNRNVGLMITSAEQMRDLQGSHTWESLIHNVDQVAPVVLRSLKNRATVTQDGEDKETLEQVVTELETEIPHMRTACQAARDTGGTSIESTRACNAIIRACQRAQDVLSRHIIGDANYKHHGIEPEKFNDTLDDLINSINRGDGAGVRGAANELADRTRDLEKRKALAAASQALKDQTKDLLAASAEALKNKDSDDAKSRLANLVSSMKANVADLAKQEEEANRRKQMLLRAAGGLGMAVDSMAGSAQAFREGSGHKAAMPTQAEMDEEERRKNERLGINASDNAAPAAASSRPKDDADLDDLLAGLDAL